MGIFPREDKMHCIYDYLVSKGFYRGRKEFLKMLIKQEE